MFSISKKCKEIQIKCHALADEYFGVGSEIMRLAQIQRPLDVPQLCMIYDKIASLIIQNGSFIL
jgi:hypothetical protein